MKYVSIILDALYNLYGFALYVFESVGLFGAICGMIVIFNIYRLLIVPIVGRSITSGSSDSVKSSKFSRRVK